MQLLSRLLRSPFLLLATFLTLLVLTGRAWAADAPPAPDVDAAAWLKALYAAVTGKQWGILVGVVLIGVVYPLRRFGPDVFKTPFGGIALAFLVSLAGTLGITLAAGADFSLGLVVTALTTAATAAGVWEWLKSHLPSVKAAADKAVAP